MRLKPNGGDPRLRLRKRGGGAATPKTSRYARHGEGEAIVIREFLGTDVECIESVGAVGAMLALLLKCFVKEPLKFAKEFVKALFLS